MSAKQIFEERHLENPADKFAVNLKEHLCSCRRWELTYLPCVHALSSLKSKNHKVDGYISEYYRKSRYMKVYKHVKQIIVNRASQPATQTSQQSTHKRENKLPVRRPSISFVQPEPTTRLDAAKSAVEPTTRRTTPTKRTTPKKKI